MGEAALASRDLETTTTEQEVETNLEPTREEDDAELTPRERALAVLAKVNSAEAKLAKRELELGRAKFSRLEKIYQQFLVAYGSPDTRGSRELFISYLENAPLQRTRRPLDRRQQAKAATNVLLTNATADSYLTPMSPGMREALDPKTELTPDEEAKLGMLTLASGRNALQERRERQYLLMTEGRMIQWIDVEAVYRSPRPHLAAYRSAARDCGYTNEEIDMATAALTDAQLWRPANADEKSAMPATLELFQRMFGKIKYQSMTIVIADLEDARSAIAMNLTLEELRQAREHTGFQADFQGKMKSEEVRSVIELYLPGEWRPVFGPVLDQLVTGNAAERSAAASRLQVLALDLDPKGAKALRYTIDNLRLQYGITEPRLELLQTQLRMVEEPVPGELTTLSTPPDLLNPMADRRADNQKKRDEQTRQAKARIAEIEAKLAQGALRGEELASAYDMIAFLYKWHLHDDKRAESYTVAAFRIRNPNFDKQVTDLTIRTPPVETPSMSGVAPIPQESMYTVTTPDKKLRALYSEAIDTLEECWELRHWIDKKNGWHQTSQFYAGSIVELIGPLDLDGVLGGKAGELDGAMNLSDDDPKKEAAVAYALSDVRSMLRKLRPNGKRAAKNLDEIRESGYAMLGRLQTAVKFVPGVGKFVGAGLKAVEGLFRVVSGDWTLEEAVAKVAMDLIDAKFGSKLTGSATMVGEAVKSFLWTTIKDSSGEIVGAVTNKGLTPEQRGHKIAAAVGAAMFKALADVLGKLTSGALKIKYEDQADLLKEFVGVAKYLGLDQALYADIQRLKNAWKAK